MTISFLSPYWAHHDVLILIRSLMRQLISATPVEHLLWATRTRCLTFWISALPPNALRWPLYARSGHRPLPQRDDQPVEVGGNNQPDLAARQRQHRAVLVG